MLLLDVNVLVAAHRADHADHAVARRFVGELANGDAAFGAPDLVCSGCLRVLTHPRAFAEPTTLGEALAFVRALRGGAAFVDVAPGRRHFDIFLGLCERLGARGNAIPDVYLAALAIESGSEWITFDRGFARFPGLRWREPGG